MIGESRNNLDPNQSKGKIALRDAFVVFLLTLVSSLLTAGYPPKPEILYTSALTALLTGIISYMHALGIKEPQA